MKDSLTSSFSAIQQLVVYADDRNNTYIEIHEVLEIRGKKQLSEGKPLTKKALKKMLDLVLSSDKKSLASVAKLMPPTVIYFDPRPGKFKLIWYNPAMERTIIREKKRDKAKLPAMLYVLDDDCFSVYTMKTGSRRPDLNTQLYHTPLPNVYDDGRVCMGNVSAPKLTSELADLISGWELAFWGSKFTDHLWGENNDKLLSAAIRSNKQYPSKQLIPHKKTLKNLI